MARATVGAEIIRSEYGWGWGAGAYLWAELALCGSTIIVIVSAMWSEGL
jgi:hypothetical protein